MTDIESFEVSFAVVPNDVESEIVEKFIGQNNASDSVRRD